MPTTALATLVNPVTGTIGNPSTASSTAVEGGADEEAAPVRTPRQRRRYAALSGAKTSYNSVLRAVDVDHRQGSRDGDAGGSPRHVGDRRSVRRPGWRGEAKAGGGHARRVAGQAPSLLHPWARSWRAHSHRFRQRRRQYGCRRGPTSASRLRSDLDGMAPIGIGNPKIRQIRHAGVECDLLAVRRPGGLRQTSLARGFLGHSVRLEPSVLTV